MYRRLIFLKNEGVVQTEVGVLYTVYCIEIGCYGEGLRTMLLKLQTLNVQRTQSAIPQAQPFVGSECQGI